MLCLNPQSHYFLKTLENKPTYEIEIEYVGPSVSYQTLYNESNKRTVNFGKSSIIYEKTFIN